MLLFCIGKGIIVWYVYIYICMYTLLVWRWFVAGRQRENLEAGALLGKDDSIAYLGREMFDLVYREVGR